MDDVVADRYRRTRPLRRPTVLCLLGTLLGGNAACSSGRAAEADAGKRPTVVVVQPVARRPIARVLTYAGDIAAEVEVRVFSIVTDRIVRLEVEEGDSIREGDLVAIVRADTLGQGIQQALGGLNSARAQVDGLRDSVERQQRLLASGVISQAQVDSTRFQLQAAEAQMAQLEATVGSARTRRSDANIRSPISGIVGQVFLDEGDLATPQIPICTVVREDRVEVQIQVPERDLGLVRPGMEAEIRAASVAGKVFRAPVARMSPVVDRLSRTATLRIMLDNPDSTIRPGSLADVRLEVERHDDALVVPQYALVLDERPTDGGGAGYRAYVLRADRRTVEERRLGVGIYEGDEVEVTEGLRAGEMLVVEGQHLLHDGDEVEVRGPDGGGQRGGASAVPTSRERATP